MTDNIAISISNISKVFKRYQRPADRLKEILLPGKSYVKEFWALRDISLEIPRGETWGIIGRNGAGKSTLLKIITGTLQPTSGTVQVNGRVSALLELGSGFNPEFTGRQNVFFNARLLGLSQPEIEHRFEDIVAFADIGDFLEQPVKTYSSGMRARLAFAVASSVDPDILIVDEVLAVGDVAFQHKCTKRIRQMMEQGTTTLFVSHSASSIKTLCTWSVLLWSGMVQAIGKPDLVLSKYMKTVTDEQLAKQAPTPAAVSEETAPTDSNNISETNIDVPKEEVQFHRRGSEKARIKSIVLKNSRGALVPNNGFCSYDELVELSVVVRAFQALSSAVIGFYVCDKNGNEIIGSNTDREKLTIDGLAASTDLEVSFRFKLPLRPGSYSITVAGSENYESVTFDWIDNAIVFQVMAPDGERPPHAMVSIPIEANVLKAFGVGIV